MKVYTYQIGEGNGDGMPVPSHSEAVYADSLGEAIDKAKAITHLRPVHDKETSVRIVESAANEYPLWAASVEEVRMPKGA